MGQSPEIVNCAAPSSSILAADESTPFEVHNETGAATVLFVCAYASRFISGGRSADWVSARKNDVVTSPGILALPT